MNNETEIPKIVVSRKKFNGLVKKVQENNLQEISFEFLVASLFPNVYQNMKEALRLQHVQGYTEGLADAKAQIESTEKETEE